MDVVLFTSLDGLRQNKENTFAEWLKVAKRVLPTYFMIILPIVMTSTFLKGEPGPWPKWPRMVIELICAALLDDFLLYWLHRISHWPAFYFFHKAHHEFEDPFGLTSAYMHPLEALLVTLLSGVGGLVFLSHIYQIIPLLLFRSFLNVEHHCGYAYPWNPQRWLPIFIGAHFHDFHHEAFVRLSSGHLFPTQYG